MPTTKMHRVEHLFDADIGGCVEIISYLAAGFVSNRSALPSPHGDHRQ